MWKRQTQTTSAASCGFSVCLDDRGMKSLFITSFPYQNMHLIIWWLPIVLSLLSFFFFFFLNKTTKKLTLSNRLWEWKGGAYVRAVYQGIWIFSASFGLSQKQALSICWHRWATFRLLTPYSCPRFSLSICHCRIYNKLPEVTKKKEEEKKRAVSQTNRLRVEAFKKVDMWHIPHANLSSTQERCKNYLQMWTGWRW